MLRTLRPITAGILVIAWATPVFADVVSVSGDAVAIGPPASAGVGQLEDARIQAFNERRSVDAAGTMVWSVTNGATYDRVESLHLALLEAGTVVTSHMLHFDAPGSGTRNVARGTFTFDAPIVGLIFDPDALAIEVMGPSDALFGLPIEYAPVSSRNLKILPTEDHVTVSTDGRSLDVSFAAVELDEIRVLTLVEARADAGADRDDAGAPAVTPRGAGGCAASRGRGDAGATSLLAMLAVALARRRRRRRAVEAR